MKMLTHEFINNLAFLLKDMQTDERDKAIAYYCELIADKIECGENEEEVIAQFGDIGVLAESIIAESPQPYKYINNNKSKSNNTVIIVLLILLSPIWFGIGIGILAAVFGLLIAIFAVVISLFVTSAGLILAGIALFITSLLSMGISVAYSFSGIAASFILCGVGILFLIGTLYLFKGCIALFNILIDSVKDAFARRKAR